MGSPSDSSQSSEDSALLSAINITPFVDVVLVLLVIFMVTTPVLMKDLLDIHLPQTKSADGPRVNTLAVVINKKEQILLNGEIISLQDLSARIKKSLSENSEVSQETQAIISADIELPYGKVVRIIDIIKTAGLEKFALQIEKIPDDATSGTANQQPSAGQ
jgi:biopolymer transport protein ExbD